MIDMRIIGDAAVLTRLGSFPERLQRRLSGVMTRLGVDLGDAVAENLSGRVLQRRSGKLAQAQNVRLDEGAEGLMLSLGFDNATVPYGAIQEFGGTTRAHLIAAKQAKALAFSLGGQLVFAKRVNHPGSRIPAHSFLRSALAELAPEALATLRDAVAAESAA
ncbi:MAG TPA: hypothetical protein VN832_01400 [Stellaceae bacterium]|nr:hypothetical protein [Stellaceae bacterium]